MRFISLIIIFILILPFSSALDINEFKTEIDVYFDGVSKVKHEIIIESVNENDLIYIPVYEPESMIISDNFNDLNYAIVSNFIIIKPKRNAKNYKIKLQYLTNELTSKEDKEWIAAYTFPALNSLNYRKIIYSQISFYLPSSSKIVSSSENNVIAAHDNMFKISWENTLTESEETSFFVKYESTATPISKENRIVFTFVLIVLSIILLVIFIHYVFDKYVLKISQGKKAILQILNERERLLVQLLLESKEKVTQASIHKETGMSKATLSRVVKRLAKKKIIEIEPLGNTNFLVLSKWFKDK